MRTTATLYMCASECVRECMRVFCGYFDVLMKNVPKKIGSSKDARKFLRRRPRCTHKHTSYPQVQPHKHKHKLMFTHLCGGVHTEFRGIKMVNARNTHTQAHPYTYTSPSVVSTIGMPVYVEAHAGYESAMMTLKVFRVTSRC